ncbi:hypothetical protein [Paenibacillus xylaniclasticus]|uniref:hypothetical protein n=1 Tax=Paenibacillus xylaniclasticus TaxID=588083 RepID=UPI000FD80543|nr:MULTISPECIES: hypothetical protein [Paenibacillus]GFN32086.1 hypothetical protein PCURB6_23460 [Paenibacillus curdlanolyticus]
MRGGDSGSIVLEASIVVPIFLLLITALVIIIQSSAAQIALHSASAQTAKQIAAHWHPLTLASEQLAAAAGEGGAAEQKLASWREIAADAAAWLPEPIGTLSSAALRGDTGVIVDYAASAGARSVLLPVLEAHADPSALMRGRVALSEAVLPSAADGEKAYVELLSEYAFPIRVPFTGQALVLKERAVERAWIPDPVPASAAYASGAAVGLTVQLVSLEPEPLRPGRQATVVARTSPNTPLTLSVLYKSGYSRARNVGTVTSDADGYATWTWLVSGNTTPGIWSLEVQAEGGVTAGRTFVVESLQKG